ARLEDAKDDPAKLQAIYSELAKYYGIRTADERGMAWLDIPGAGKKHTEVVSLYYSEKFPAAESASEKNHAVFGIRFSGARMYFDEKAAKDGYNNIGTKVFGEGYRTFGNSDLYVIIGAVADNNKRYAYEKELANIPKGPEGAGARDALYARLSKEMIKVP